MGIEKLYKTSYIVIIIIIIIIILKSRLCKAGRERFTSYQYEVPMQLHNTNP